MSSTEKPSVSPARGGLQPALSADLPRSTEGVLGGLTKEALERATGSPEIKGNSLRLQFDGPVTFDAWLEAITGAKRYVHFENYILRNDPVGRAFRDVLLEKARQGVEVRVLYDWVGCWATPRRYWRPFRSAGVEVRAFNRPSLRDPYGVFQRDHRKLVVVDGEVAFAGGFCIGQEWAGTGDDPPWRDTGIDAGYSQLSCPNAERAAYEQSVWLSHELFLGSEADVDDIATAIEKITTAWREK